MFLRLETLGVNALHGSCGLLGGPRATHDFWIWERLTAPSQVMIGGVWADVTSVPAPAAAAVGLHGDSAT